MNAGDGPNSYANNSDYQRGIMESAKTIISEEIIDKLDIQRLCLSASEPLKIADLGCSSGPNTILAIGNIVETLDRKFQSHGLITPEFQVFFSDQVSNDFNSLLASLPVGRKYYAAGVPGSFHGRLFPKASLHFVYSSSALHWLSEVPRGVIDKNGTAWNGGRIHYTGASKEVFEAYSDQFREDIDSFIKARVEELAPGALMVFTIPGVPDSVASGPQLTTGSEIALFESCLMDMVKMGKVDKEKADNFNLPMYFTSPNELQQIIELNGRFSIERIEILNNPNKHTVMPDLRQRTMFIRAVFLKHFGGSAEIVDQLFDMYSTKLSQSPIFLNSDYQERIAILVILKLKHTV